jgi:hypothetical protein
MLVQLVLTMHIDADMFLQHVCMCACSSTGKVSWLQSYLMVCVAAAGAPGHHRGDPQRRQQAGGVQC